MKPMISSMHSVARGKMVDLVDSQRLEVDAVVGNIFLGHFEHGDAPFVGLLDQLIIDIGDVDDPVTS